MIILCGVFKFIITERANLCGIIYSLVHMNTSARRRGPSTGPVRLAKSDGQFTPKNILDRAKSALSSRNDNFTAVACLPAGSLDRPNIRSMNCNQTCPGGYASFGYDGTEWNYGSACQMYNMICVKANYDKDTPSVVADCCNGVTAQKDCDSSLCRGSQTCRDKMRSICDAAGSFGSAACQTWLSSGENADMKAEILSKYCTAESLATGQCRAFAQSSASHGLMDAAVISWCTGKIPNPPIIDPKITEFARWRNNIGPQPSWYSASSSWNPSAYMQTWDMKMQLAIAQFGLDAVLHPQITYRDNSKDPICACILSPLNKYGDKAAPPSCFDTTCVATGYQTGGMKTISSKCPSWIECRSNINAIAGGTNEQVNVQQICGGDPIVPTVGPSAVTPTVAIIPVGGPIRDDKDLLKEDEARGTTGTAAPPIALVAATPSIMEQLKKPFLPNLLGDTSILSVAILFFALVIISAILWRTWMNRRSRDLQTRLQSEQELMATSPQVSPESQQIRETIQGQMYQMPRVASSVA